MTSVTLEMNGVHRKKIKEMYMMTILLQVWVTNSNAATCGYRNKQSREKMAEGESKVFSGHGSLQISMAKEQE